MPRLRIRICRLIQLFAVVLRFSSLPLNRKDISLAIDRALADQERGLGKMPLELADNARQQLIRAVNGDLRSALNGLELAAKSTDPAQDGKIHLTLPIIEECVQKKHWLRIRMAMLTMTLSLLSKSIRGSDVDAALHYLARLIAAGDLPSIARRLTVIAYEDIGLANPPAVQRAITAIQAAEKLVCLKLAFPWLIP